MASFECTSMDLSRQRFSHERRGSAATSNGSKNVLDLRISPRAEMPTIARDATLPPNRRFGFSRVRIFLFGGLKSGSILRGANTEKTRKNGGLASASYKINS